MTIKEFEPPQGCRHPHFCKKSLGACMVAEIIKQEAKQEKQNPGTSALREALAYVCPSSEAEEARLNSKHLLT